MIFGKHINKYYFKYAGWLLLGLAALVLVDYIQLIVPNLYQQVINGVNQGFIDYALPLIAGENVGPKVNGLPRFAQLKKIKAEA